MIRRCGYRRQTLKVFVIKIFVLLGPQRPTLPFLTYAYFHYSDIKQTEKMPPLPLSSSLSFSLSLSSVSLRGCENCSPREYLGPMSPWGRRPEDTLWGCIERCFGERIIWINVKQIEQNWPIWDFSKKDVEIMRESGSSCSDHKQKSEERYTECRHTENCLHVKLSFSAQAFTL